MPKFEALDREGFTLFEPEMLLREVQGIDVNWMEGYGNTPDLCITLPEGVNSWDYFQGIRGEDGVNYRMYEELPLFKSNIYYADHPMGFVSYFSHCGSPHVNEGGFGGAYYGVHLPDGTHKVLRGPWSSRATCVNIAVSHHPDLVIMDVRGARALKEVAVKVLLEHFEFPYYILRQKANGVEQNAYCPSTQPDGIIKPSGMRCMDYKDNLGYDIFYSPK